MKIPKFLKLLLAGAFFRLNAVDDDDDDDSNAGVGTGTDARLALYNSIADNADDARDGDLEDLPSGGTAAEEGEDQPFQLSEDTPTDVQVGDEDQPSDDAQEKAAAPATFRIKVNGQEKELTIDELIARAQKVDSADEYLRNASELYQEAQKRGAPNSETPPTRPAADTGTVDEEDLALARAIQIGTEEEAVQAVRKLRARGPSTDDLVRQIDDRMLFQTAIQQFQQEFPDIVGNPRLYQMAIQEDARLVRGGDKRPYHERYTEVGNGIRSWLKDVAGAVTEPAKNTLKDKQSRKESAPTPPKPVASKAPQAQEEEREPTTQEVIAEMAKVRGGSQYMRG